MCKESAKELRSKLKEIGYNRNMVSVTSDYDSINVTVKSIEVDFKKVEKLANSYESFRTDERTGEILLGGNTYVNVKYSDTLKDELKNKYMSKAEEIANIKTSGNYSECIFENGQYRILYTSEYERIDLQKYNKEWDSYEEILRHMANNKYAIAEALAYFFLNEKFDILAENEDITEVEKVEEIKAESETIAETQTTNTTTFTVNEDTHTKTGAIIFVAKLNNKIEYTEFKNIESRIKSIGGYYSRFKKGFIFESDPTELLKKEFNNSIEQFENVEEVEQPKQQEIIINEDLARQSKQNMSFSDYKEGSATAEYNRVVENMAQKINEAKEQVKEDDEKINELNYLLFKFKKDYANWINKHNSNGSSHVSWMISGRGNYNMNKHSKWETRESKLWAEYNDIMAIDSKIDKIVYSTKIIKSTDSDALEKLKEKLEQEQKAHDEMVNYNKQARKEKKEVYPTYMLSNSNQRIKNIKDRISQLEKLEELKQTKGNTEIEINGIKIIDNLEANRVQMIFPDKPEENIRKILKSNGFRWSPSFGAWQRNRGKLSADKAKSIAESLKDNNSIAV